VTIFHARYYRWPGTLGLALRKIIIASSVRAVERYDVWASIQSEIGVGGDAPEDAGKSFNATLSISQSASLMLLDFDMDKSPVYRLRQQIRRMEWGQYWIYRERSAGVRIQLGDREISTSPGDLVIADADAPFRTLAQRRYQHHIWMISRATVDRHLPPLPRPIGIHLPGSDNVTQLILAYFDALADKLESLSPALSALAADHIARLISVGCGGAAKAHVTAIHTARLEKARQYIENNLSMHGLNPEMAAAALGISLRQLHLYFEPGGESFGQYTRRRRLEECRAALEDPAATGRSITDIAFAWGFSSLPTFYRSFNDAFGVPPGDVRENARMLLKMTGDRTKPRR
jgi:AraC-like DNA-binding protein